MCLEVRVYRAIGGISRRGNPAPGRVARGGGGVGWCAWICDPIGQAGAFPGGATPHLGGCREEGLVRLDRPAKRLFQAGQRAHLWG